VVESIWCQIAQGSFSLENAFFLIANDIDCLTSAIRFCGLKVRDRLNIEVQEFHILLFGEALVLCAVAGCGESSSLEIEERTRDESGC